MFTSCDALEKSGKIMIEEMEFEGGKTFYNIGVQFIKNWPTPLISHH